MDATTSPQVPSKFSDVCNLLFESRNKDFTPTLVRKNTIVKYAKLPEYDFNSKASWRQPESYVLPVKLRKIIALEDQALTSTHTEIQVPVKFIATKHTMRKTVTITDQDDAHQITRLQKTSSARYSHRAVGGDNDTANFIRTPTRTITKSNRKVDKSSVKSASWNNSKDVTKNDRGKFVNNNYNLISPDAKSRNTNSMEKKNIHNNRSHNGPSNVSVSKSMIPPSVNEPDLCHIKSKLTETIFRSEMSSKKSYLRPKASTLTPKPCKLNEIVKSNKGVVAIHIPPDTTTTTTTKKLPRQMRLQKFTRQTPLDSEKIECGVETERNMYITKEVLVQTQVPKAIGTQTVEVETLDSKIHQTNEEISDLNVISYDCLDTPNFKLTKDRKCTPKENIVSIDHKQSLSTLVLQPFQGIPTKKDNFDNGDSHQKCPELLLKWSMSSFESQPLKNIEEINDEDSRRNNPELNLKASMSSFESLALKNPIMDENNRNDDSPQNNHLLIDGENKPQKNPSFIISQHTLTYTTKQEINMDLGSRIKETSPLDHSISNLSPSLLDYPLNVMTVFKSENIDKLGRVSAAPTMEKPQTTKEKSIQIEHMNRKVTTSVDCTSPYVSCKLIKPSEIISTIRVNTGLLQNDYICKQFERELNFIDSFFESLQYLENCSLSDKCCADGKVENWVNSSGFGNPEYDSLFSNLENGAATDTETMASKSLCLLNLLIRDEQRRAKNLLFVLKMREDALKDFTKSQILWLENKKKLENTDISTLKKKQRGALLKLQHECGEMQRMRKALLALSEKRKVALMKTKNNLELKLKSNVTVDQILLGKKKLKRSTVTDRNIAPLKCFDLSSSGCDDVTPPRAKSDTQLLSLEKAKIYTNIAEKCVQTGDSLLGSSFVDSATDTAAENFVTVDGSYLNILFQNMSLPQIFSAGKQYEVNEEALKNILNTNSFTKSESDVIDKFMDQIKKRDQDSAPSSPSTARSLVEELDQYYKGLADEDKLPLLLEENVSTLDLLKESLIVETQSMEIPLNQTVSHLTLDTGICDADKEDKVPDNTLNIVMDVINETNNKQVVEEEEPLASSGVLTGPLPVPTGAVTVDDAVPPDGAICMKSSIGSIATFASQESQSSGQTMSMSSLASPVLNEAEELRRQQLAIEREIKALEQQQCQLLAVREIPDKPPPPYTPPADVRTPRASRMFQVDDTIDDKVHNQLCKKSEVTIEPSDVFDVYLQDFCEETINKQKLEQSDKPWDAYNLLPQKSPIEMDKLAASATAEVKELLSGLATTAVSGVGARRSDHIDDILFTEWRRCESEWTALHIDEAAIKNQIFEGIFQRILTEVIDEYKKTVHRVHKTDNVQS